jgi:putative ABC transport system permease protein
MGVLLKIAYRNLREHKVKTIIIGSIIALALMILVIGNSLIDTAAEGVRGMYSSNFTGHIMITSSRYENPTLFMAPVRAFDGPTPIIQDYPQLVEYLSGLDGVEDTVSQISGFATAQFDEGGSGFLQLFSVDPTEYLAMFPGTFEMLEGDFLMGEEEGIVLSEHIVLNLSDTAGREIHLGDSLLLTNMNVVSGTKIREVKVKGIFRFHNETPNLSFISFLDLTSMRVLSGMTKMTDPDVELNADERENLGSVNEDDLFGGGFLGETSISADPFSEDDLCNILGDRSGLALFRELNTEAWHYVLLKLEDNKNTELMVRSLNTYFGENGIELQADNWVQAAGSLAQLVNSLKIIFNILILVIGVVAVIIIMNTIVISVTERIGEIGTMRAIGAQRRFIRSMITIETLMISLVFGAVGITTGGITIGILHYTGIEATNIFMQVLFGGNILVPVLNPESVFSSFSMVVLVGIFASLYPAAVALRIEPVRAMNQRS